MRLKRKANDIEMFDQWQLLLYDGKIAWWGHEYSLGHALEALMRYLDVRFYKDGELYTEKQVRKIFKVRNEEKSNSKTN